MNTSNTMVIFGCLATLIGSFISNNTIVIIGNIWMVGAIICQKIDNKRI